MSNVVSLTGQLLEPTAPGEPNPAVVETLKELLAMAESGQVTGIAGVGQTEQGATLVVLAGFVDVSTVGLLERTKMQILLDMQADD